MKFSRKISRPSATSRECTNFWSAGMYKLRFRTSLESWFGSLPAIIGRHTFRSSLLESWIRSNTSINWSLLLCTESVANTCLIRQTRFAWVIFAHCLKKCSSDIQCRQRSAVAPLTGFSTSWHPLVVDSTYRNVCCFLHIFSTVIYAILQLHILWGKQEHTVYCFAFTQGFLPFLWLWQWITWHRLIH